MALIVNDISIANEQTNVYIDTSIKITFNKAIDAVCLTSANFKLYTTENNAIIGTHNIVINQPENTPNIIEIVPQPTLAKTTKFILFVAGDHNIADALLQGISAIDGDTMDGNYSISFTTGTDIGDPTIESPDIHVTPSDISTTTTETIIDSYTILATSPYNGQSQLTTVSELVMKFNKPVTDINAFNVRVDVEKATWPFTDIDQLYTSSGYVLGSGYFNLTKTEYHVPVDNNYVTLINNHLYGVYVDAIGDFSGYEWFYMSKLWPAYADVKQVRSSTGLVFDDVPDAIIWLRIHDNSLYYSNTTGITYATEIQVPYEVNKWVVCKTIVDLYNLIKGVNKAAGSIIRKTLGDLTIEYASPSKLADNSVVPEQFERCAEINWALINNRNANSNHTVKSVSTAYYPGRARRF